MIAPARTLFAEEIAAEFRRFKAWIYENWKRPVAQGVLPQPLIEAGHLVCSAAHVYAYLDKDLPPKLRDLVAALGLRWRRPPRRWASK